MNVAMEASKEKVNILLVDDQPARLLSYEAILSELGENLVQARSGPEALQLLMERDFAVILLDVNMPEMDGFETASLIHQHPRFENTPIIFVTGIHVTDFDRMRGYSLGAVDYVYIPVVPEILRGKVSVLVELYSKRQELLRLNRSLEAANEELARANSSLQLEKQQELERLNRNLEIANSELADANQALQRQILERIRAEERLMEADRRKDEFLAILSHELRNPLAPLRNAAEIMRRITLDNPQLVWARGVIERQVENLRRLVDELLDVSRITRGLIKLQQEPIDLVEVVTRAIETTRPMIDARKMELAVELPSKPSYVNGDLTRLSQVLANLLGNAAKYTQEGGKIALTIEHEAASQQAIVRVSDNGVGIPPEMLPRVFELFTQVERTLDRAQGGLGVGLALVRHLVEMHGGSVVANSDGSHGSEFVVRLPLCAAPPQSVDSVAVTSAPATAARRILVADDNEDAATSLATLLRHERHEVQAATDGVQAMEILRGFRPDIAFLDIGMPRLDGYGLARWIREQSWGKNIVLVALTGWGQEEDRRRTHDAGFNFHMVKPVELKSLLGVLSGAQLSVR